MLTQVDWEDIGFQAEFSPDQTGDMIYRVELKVWEVVGRITSQWGRPVDPPQPLYLIPGAKSSYETTTDRAQAEVFLCGEVKWDHCSHLTFTESYHHFCSREQASNIGVLLGRIYDTSKEIMGKSWD